MRGCTELKSHIWQWKKDRKIYRHPKTKKLCKVWLHCCIEICMAFGRSTIINLCIPYCCSPLGAVHFLNCRRLEVTPEKWGFTVDWSYVWRMNHGASQNRRWESPDPNLRTQISGSIWVYLGPFCNPHSILSFLVSFWTVEGLRLRSMKFEHPPCML